MQFSEIRDNILKAANWYEKKKGIKTLKVMPIKKLSDDLWIFIGFKSDFTKTVFIVFKKSKRSDKSWDWWCPSESQFENLDKIKSYYKEVNKENSIRREKIAYN